jgi:hypothetical protein
MPPLPSQPALERVNLALAKEQGREANHKRHLSILLNSLRSDSIDVRLVAAGELLIFLQNGRSLIMASASSSPSSASRPLVMPARSSISAAAATASSSGGSMEAEDGDVLFEDVPGADLLSATLSALLRCCDNVMRTHQGRKLRLK